MTEDTEQTPDAVGSEETPKEQNASTHVETSEIVVSGSHANIHVNKASHQDFLTISEQAFQKGYDIGSSHNALNERLKTLEESLLNKKEQKEAEDTGTPSSVPEKDLLQLQTVDDIADWYEKLPDTYTQYIVQTMVCLQGASATDIARLARNLHMPSGTGLTPQPGSPAQHARHLSDREIYRQAFMEKRRINGVARTFWKGFDNVEQQRLTVLVLRFFAEETSLHSGQDLTDVLQEWAEHESNDCAWRAARALGIILFWRSSTQDLWRQANRWANSTRMRDWRTAAALLSGAYSVEWTEDRQRASDPKRSDILRLLNQWVDRAQKPAGWRVGCAAAEAFDLFDQYNPDTALDGLEKLLRFPDSGVPAAWESISVLLFMTCISNYVSIAWSNHIRNVLDRLAKHIKTLVYQPNRPTQIDDELRYQGQCELQLDAILTIFFFAAAISSKEAQAEANYSLTEALPAQPTLPDTQGRDILLAGLLSAPEQQWRTAISSLLCASFFTENEEKALYVMRQWTDTIEAVTQGDSADQQEIQAAYYRFIIDIYHMIEAWQTELHKTGFGTVPVGATFKYYLSSWLESADWDGKTNTDFIRSFARKILTHIGEA